MIGVAETEEVAFEVYSLDGRMIKAGKLDNAQANLADIPSGIYLLQLHSEGKTETKKIIKNERDHYLAPKRLINGLRQHQTAQRN